MKADDYLIEHLRERNAQLTLALWASTASLIAMIWTYWL